MNHAAHATLAAMSVALCLLASPAVGHATEKGDTTSDGAAELVLATNTDGSEDAALKALEWIGSPVETSDGDLLGTLRGVVRSYEDGEPDRLTIELGDSTDFEVPLSGVIYRDGRVIVPAERLGEDRGITEDATPLR